MKLEHLDAVTQLRDMLVQMQNDLRCLKVGNVETAFRVLSGLKTSRGTTPEIDQAVLDAARRLVQGRIEAITDRLRGYGIEVE
jgi:hypothetical protein